MAAWLMKTEPETFSIADLERVRLEPWTGVRNYVARNHMRAMAVGDDVLIYHSSCEPPGVAGLAKVAETGVVDATQFDPESPYYDPRSKPEKPLWDCVRVEYVETLPRLVPLGELRAEKSLGKMLLFQWSRLSVQPVTPAQLDKIIAMSRATPKASPPARPARRRRPGKTPRKARASRSRRS
jgi:predicted RNA-binding protein with PUA-like domain